MSWYCVACLSSVTPVFGVKFYDSASGEHETFRYVEDLIRHYQRWVGGDGRSEPGSGNYQDMNGYPILVRAVVMVGGTSYCEKHVKVKI